MGSESSSSLAAGVTESVDAIISAYAEKTRPLQSLLVLYVALGAMSVLLLLVVFYFSTPRIRRTPLFMIVVFDILIGIAVACWLVTDTLGILLKPLQPSYIAIALLTFFSPWVIDLVLLLRLCAVFPIATTPRRTICVVFAFAACVKAARLGCGIAQTVRWIPALRQDLLTLSGHTLFSDSSLLKAMSACKLMDHIFVAACFLWKISIARSGTGHRLMRPDDAVTKSLSSRLRMVFYIALGNFVFPTIFNIIMLLVIFVNSIPFHLVLFLEPINMYVNIFGIVFATIWSSGHAPVASPTTLTDLHPRSYSPRLHCASGTLAVNVTDLECTEKMGEYNMSTI